ncbi:MAG: DUF4421 family protein [Chitinophagaceae bacterium]|nr:DUF4421 family protein [Chitinophagaceae bacterium]
MRTMCLIALLVAGIQPGSFAGVPGGDTLSTPRLKTPTLEKFNDWIVIKAAFVNAAESYSVDAGTYHLELQPNPSELFRTYFNYRFVSFYITYIPHFLPANNDNDIKGRSKGGGLGLSYNNNEWFGGVSYARTKGYYVSNTSHFRPGWKEGDPYIQVPDLKITNFEAMAGYNTNQAFSMSAVSDQTQRQLKSAGAFIPRLSVRYYIVDDESPGGTTQKANNWQVLLGAGYHHTFVLYKRLYLSGAFTPAFGYIYTKLLTRDPAGNIHSTINSPIYQWDARLGFGYNGHRFFCGTYGTALSSRYTQGLSTAVNRNIMVSLQLFLGIRIGEPKALGRLYKKILPVPASKETGH